MTESQKMLIDECRRKRYSMRDMVKVTQLAEQDILDYINQKRMLTEKFQPSTTQDPTPEEIEAACAVLREQQRRNPRYDGCNSRTPDCQRMPRHFCIMPKL